MQIKKTINQLLTTNNIVFFIFCFTLLFGVFLSFQLRFDYADEMAAAALGIVCFWHIRKNPKLLLQPVIISVSAIFIFYTAYSFIVQSNVPQAILQDLLVSLKPFVGFFGVFLLVPALSGFQRKIIRYLCIIFAIACAAIASYSGGLLTGNYLSMWAFSGSLINFYLTIAVIAIVYLFSSDFDGKSFIVFFCMLAVGILTARFKLFVLIAIALSLYISRVHKNKIKINLKSALAALAIAAVVVAVAYPKINYYFINPNPKFPARQVLYSESFRLAEAHFPFGTGFASFGSFASTKYLAPVYVENNLFEILNLESAKGNYATDTFFACLLGQFGVAGILAFFGFFVWIFKRSRREFSPEKQYFTLLIIGFFLSESFTNSTFTQSFGLIVMMILGYILSEQKEKIAEI